MQGCALRACAAFLRVRFPVRPRPWPERRLLPGLRGGRSGGQGPFSVPRGAAVLRRLRLRGGHWICVLPVFRSLRRLPVHPPHRPFETGQAELQLHDGALEAQHVRLQSLHGFDHFGVRLCFQRALRACGVRLRLQRFQRFLKVDLHRGQLPLLFLEDVLIARFVLPAAPQNQNHQQQRQYKRIGYQSKGRPIHGVSIRSRISVFIFRYPAAACSRPCRRWAAPVRCCAGRRPCRPLRAFRRCHPPFSAPHRA